MKRTKWLILCLVLCMAASLGGTIAYLTDTDGDVNVMTLGNVGINLIEEERNGDGLAGFSDDKMMLPIVGELGNDGLYGLPNNPNFLDKIVRVESTGSNANAYLRVYIGLPSALRNVANTGLDALHMLTGEGISLPGSNEAGTWNQLRVENAIIDGVPFEMHCFEYQKLLTPGELTPPVITGLWLDSFLDNDVMTVDAQQFPLDYDFSVGLQVPVLVQAVQADGFTSAEQAFIAANMDTPDFDKLLDIQGGSNGSDNNDGNGGGGIDGVLKTLLDRIATALGAGEDRVDIEVKTNSLVLDDPDFAGQLNAMTNAFGANAEINIQPISPDGSTVVVELGKTALPKNVTLTAATGQSLVITGEDFD